MVAQPQRVEGFGNEYSMPRLDHDGYRQQDDLYPREEEELTRVELVQKKEGGPAQEISHQVLGGEEEVAGVAPVVAVQEIGGLCL